MNERFQNRICFCLFVRYADTLCTPGAGALNDLWIITADGRHAWKIHAVRDDVSKDAAGVLHPHYLDRPFAVATDFDWSPDGSQMMGLVITNRPDTRKRGSGIIVLIDPVY
jgi:hypothetical protein